MPQGLFLKLMKNKMKSKINPRDDGEIGEIRVSNNFLALVILMLLLVVASVNYYIYANYAAKQDVIKIQGAATGTVRLCINNPPVINNSCSPYVNVSSLYFCNINATDANGQSISYSDNSSLYNISSNGTISFNPSQSQLGTEISRAYAADNSSCTNSNASKTVNITVCMEPVWNNFRNNATTNLSLSGCWNAITNFKIGKPNILFINFTGTAGLDGYDFDAYLGISQ